MNQKRIADYGIRIGTMPKGALNKITDVKGVKVGHSTIKTDQYRTGCTVIIPSEQNVYDNKLVSAVHVQNGYGKTCGTVQIGELGTIETPIALTNTLNVGIVADAMVEYTVKRCREEEHLYLLQYLGQRLGAYRAACASDSAVGAVRITAVLDFDVGAGAVKGRDMHGLKAACCLDLGYLRICICIFVALRKQTVYNLRNAHLSFVADHSVHPVQSSALGVSLRKAARDHHVRFGILRSQAADELPAFAVGFRRDRAGVDDVCVTHRVMRSDAVTAQLQRLFYGAGFVLIDLAAKRGNANRSFYISH